MATATATPLRCVSSRAAWSTLAQRRVYFANQSVGGDILVGLKKLIARGDAPAVKLVQTREPSVLHGPAFVHFQAGSNANRLSEWRTLHEVLDARPAPDYPLVLLKYCYPDISEADDAQALFVEYRSELAALTARHPDITMVHATIPLTTVERPWKALAKRTLGRPVARAAALQRHRYIERLRATYSGAEPLFDIARAESEGPDGRRAAVMVGGQEVEILMDAYTNDGGHLNDAGRTRTALSLLAAVDHAVQEAR